MESIYEFENELFLEKYEEGEEEYFFDTLKKVKDSTRIKEGLMKDLKLFPVDETSKRSLREVPTRLPMGITIGGTDYRLYEAALPSIKRRAQNDAPILAKMTPEDQAKSLNMSWKYFDKEEGFKAIYRGGGILALMSGRYVPLYQWSVYDSFQKKMRARFGEANVKFLSGYYTHKLTLARFALDNESLMADVKSKLQQIGFPNSDAVKCIVSLYTSDVGESSVSVCMSIELSEKETLQFQNPLHIPHRDNQTFDNVVNSFDKTFALLDEGLNNIKRIADVKIKYPTSIAANLEKKKPYKLPKSLVAEIMPEFQMYEMLGQEISLLDFFRILGRVMKTDSFLRLSAKRKMALEDAIAKVAWLSDENLKRWDKKGEAIY